jgi:hypothetical protein
MGQAGRLLGDRLVAGIARQRDDPPAGRVTSCLAQRGIVAIQRHDNIPASQQPLGDRPADTPATPGNHVRTAHTWQPSRTQRGAASAVGSHFAA